MAEGLAVRDVAACCVGLLQPPSSESLELRELDAARTPLAAACGEELFLFRCWIGDDLAE